MVQIKKFWHLPYEWIRNLFNEIHEILDYLSIWGYVNVDIEDISLSTIMYIVLDIQIPLIKAKGAGRRR